MRRSIGFLVSGFLALLVVLHAGAHPAAAQAKKVVKLAGINALTDQSAAYGTRSHHGAQLAAKLLNDAGGFKDSCGNT